MENLSLSYTIEVEYLDENDDNNEFCEYDSFEEAQYEIEFNKQEGFNAVRVSVFPRFKIEGLTLDEAITECIRFEETLKKNGRFTE